MFCASFLVCVPGRPGSRVSDQFESAVVTLVDARIKGIAIIKSGQNKNVNDIFKVCRTETFLTDRT